VFADIGGLVAEEIDSVRLVDLLDPSAVENFGWGRNADGFAREGTFYIDPAGNPVGAAPPGEPGFVQPIAQWGRESNIWVAATGPVSLASGFATVTCLFGDLVSGAVLAVQGDLGRVGQDVLRVQLVDGNLRPTTLSALAGGRPDPRFFVFPDGTPGVLLERTGDLFRLDELPCGAARIETAGQPCGAESLAADAPPRLETNVELRLSGGGTGATGFVLGAVLEFVPPRDLTAIGMTGCASHVDSAFVLGSGPFDPGGVVRVPLAVPNALALCGATLLAQGFATAPGRNPLGVTSTGLVRLVVGL
jgi:hypothetical protein